MHLLAPADVVDLSPGVALCFKHSKLDKIIANHPVPVPHELKCVGSP
jgi:hypothetical protein